MRIYALYMTKTSFSVSIGLKITLIGNQQRGISLEGTEKVPFAPVFSLFYELAKNVEGRIRDFIHMERFPILIFFPLNFSPFRLLNPISFIKALSGWKVISLRVQRTPSTS